MVEKSRSIVLGHALIVCVPHEVDILLKQHAEKSLSAQRAHRYELVLLLADNLKLERCNTLNPTTRLPLPTDGEKDTQQILTFTGKSRDDITDQPLDDPEMSLFMDGSSYYDKGRWMVCFAVMTETTVLIAGPLPLSLGAQGVEVVSPTEAARYAKGKKVNIYTDSKYAFGVCHATGALWKERGFALLTESRLKIYWKRFNRQQL